jgi:2-polyprenyl-3-methyl-5-hydroxy-6-metoxy-1,4-benzoquinol methylase
MRDIFARALRESWTPAGDLYPTIRGLLERDPAIGPAIRRASESWPLRPALPDLLGAGGLIAIAGNPLLLALLEVVKVTDLNFERFLTLIRAGLLGMVAQDHNHADETILRLCCALARQCFLNEYVFDLTADQHNCVIHLRERISEAIAARADISPLALAVLASFLRLDCLPGKALLLKRSWPTSVADVIHQQIREPAAQRQYRKSIPRMTTISDGTSTSVQEQYQENPYPRWITLFRVPAPSITFDESFARDFPFSPYRKIGKTGRLDVLIAGCGTGHDAILFAQSYSGAKILALDLSLSSLSFAKHRTRTLGVNNIEYAQADILELARLERTFDVISCGGVLHHLADPEHGWRILVSLLRPNGCMHVALYSELARRDVAFAQSWLRERGYSSSIEDIRRARHDLVVAAEHEPPLKHVLRSLDFYATSECRDLLFPSRESRFTVPRIKAFLEENNLQFLGFILDGRVRNQFSKRFFPGSEIDLQLWHQFEAENPDTFTSMYQFWVQKH